MPAWTTPRTWVTGEIATATLFNTHIRDNLTNTHSEYGTSLPGSPSDGQMAILVDSTTAPTYQWQFRYNASNSTAYKWEFVGGTDLIGPVSSFSHANTTTYRYDATSSVTVPKSGVYDVVISSLNGTCSGAGRAKYAIGLGSASTVGGETYTYGTAYAGLWVVQRLTLTAANVHQIAYGVIDGSVSFSITSAGLVLRPVRVS